MADYPPPTDNTPIFNVLDFRVNNFSTLDITYLENTFLKLNAQADENMNTKAIIGVSSITWTDGTTQSTAASGSGGGGNPIGTIINFAGSSAPTDYLVCDGSLISQTTYADLYAVIGSLYNYSGTVPAGQFYLPNLSGNTSALVGADSAGNTVGNTVGTANNPGTSLDAYTHIPSLYLNLVPYGDCSRSGVVGDPTTNDCFVCGIGYGGGGTTPPNGTENQSPISPELLANNGVLTLPNNTFYQAIATNKVADYVSSPPSAVQASGSGDLEASKNIKYVSPNKDNFQVGALIEMAIAYNAFGGSSPTPVPNQNFATKILYCIKYQ